MVKATVVSAATLTRKVTIASLADPRARGWYAADLHHHADQAEAVTPAPDLARAQLAAGLDLLFVSDHDSTVNHLRLQAIADRRGIPFIPSVEMSTSWAHFNAYPVALGQPLAIDTGATTIQTAVDHAYVDTSNSPAVGYPQGSGPDYYPGSGYQYEVSAVDSTGLEGALSAPMIAVYFGNISTL